MRIYLVLLIFSCCCNTTFAQETIQQQRLKWGFAEWPQMFKDRAFCLCLLEGYQDSALKRRMLEIDRSSYDAIGVSVFDSVLIPFIKKEVDTISINAKTSYGRVSEGKAGKLVFDHCLALYKSKKLDHLLKITSPGWYKIKNIDELVSQKMPGY